MCATDASRNIAAARRGSRERTRSASRTSRSCAAAGEPRRISTWPRNRSTSASSSGSSVSAAASSSSPSARSGAPQRTASPAAASSRRPRGSASGVSWAARPRSRIAVACAPRPRASSAACSSAAATASSGATAQAARCHARSAPSTAAASAACALAPLRQRRRVVDGRAHQRVAELELALAQRDDPRLLGRLEVDQRQPGVREPAADRVQPPGARRRGDEQRAARRSRAAPRSRPRTRARRSVPGRSGSSSGSRPASWASDSRPGDLQQRERVAGRGGDEPVGDAGRDRGVEQLARLVVRQRLDRAAGPATAPRRGGPSSRAAPIIATPSCPSRRPANRNASSDGSSSHCASSIIDQHGPLVGGAREQRQQRGGNGEAVGRGGRTRAPARPASPPPARSGARRGARAAA